MHATQSLHPNVCGQGVTCVWHTCEATDGQCTHDGICSQHARTLWDLGHGTRVALVHVAFLTLSFAGCDVQGPVPACPRRDRHV